VGQIEQGKPGSVIVAPAFGHGRRPLAVFQANLLESALFRDDQAPVHGAYAWPL
jgi:hypothetical protein